MKGVSKAWWCTCEFLAQIVIEPRFRLKAHVDVWMPTSLFGSGEAFPLPSKTNCDFGLSPPGLLEIAGATTRHDLQRAEALSVVVFVACDPDTLGSFVFVGPIVSFAQIAWHLRPGTREVNACASMYATINAT